MTTKVSKEPKEITCYYCGKPIINSLDHVVKKVPLQTKRGIRNYRRNLHLDCVSKYNEGLTNVELKSAENSDWEKAFNYFRDEVLKVNSAYIKANDKKSHLAQRILGLRVGQYYPSSNNTRILPRGYSFKTILITLKVVNPKIQAFARTANFTGFKHRIDAYMKFVVSEIPDVDKRIKRQEEANRKLDEQTITPTVEVDYSEDLKKKIKEEGITRDNGAKDDIALLFGGLF